MIELTVDNRVVILNDDAKIGIEKSSPILTSKIGAFSYPFPVPRSGNQETLGHPGRLERSGNIPLKSFILKDDGVQVLRGQVDYDPTSDAKTGLILQSGNTEFSSKMENVKLSDLDLGSFATATDFQNVVAQWDAFNDSNSDNYICVPFVMHTPYLGRKIVVNASHGPNGNIYLQNSADGVHYFCLQFKFSFILRKIYEKAGFRVITDQLKGTELDKVFFFGKVFRLLINSSGGGQYNVVFSPYDRIDLADLMPDNELVLDFIERAKSIFCFSTDVNENKKTVSFYLNKNVFKAENLLSSYKDCEVLGWEHSERKSADGVILKYSDQTVSSYDNEYDYSVYDTVATHDDLPEITDLYKNMVVKISNQNKFFKAINNGTEVSPDWQWVLWGRLKAYAEGNADEEFIIDAQVPGQIQDSFSIEAGIDVSYEMPFLELDISQSNYFTNIPFSLSVYHGKELIGSDKIPVSTFDEISIDGERHYSFNLLASTLYDNVYRDFMSWKAYRSRGVIKYLKISLSDVVNLNWYKRYVISGIPVVLNKVNFDLPYAGICKISGYTS